MDRFVLLWFKGYTSITDVEPFTGCLIWAEKPSDLRYRKPDDYFVHELFHLQIMENNQNRGIVSDVIMGPAYDYLQIKKDEKEYLLPFIRIFVKEINLLEGYLIVSCPDGFWE